MNRFFLKTLVLAAVLFVSVLWTLTSDEHNGRAQVRTRSVARSDSVAQSGSRTWGRLANPGVSDKTIKTTLFFAGRPLDGTGSENPNDPFYNGIGPSAVVQDCY